MRMHSVMKIMPFDGRASLAHSGASFRGFLSLGSWMASQKGPVLWRSLQHSHTCHDFQLVVDTVPVNDSTCLRCLFPDSSPTYPFCVAVYFDLLCMDLQFSTWEHRREKRERRPTNDMFSLEVLMFVGPFPTEQIPTKSSTKRQNFPQLAVLLDYQKVHTHK